MSKPLDVTIVRPSRTRAETFGDFVASLITLALRAWVVILLAPVAFGINPGFWQAVAAIYAFSVFFGLKDSALTWTRPAAKETRA